MKILVLTSRPDLKTNSRLAEAAEVLGYSPVVVDTSTLSALASSDGLRAAGGGGFDDRPDVVIARVGNWRPDSTLAVLEALVASGATTPNPPAAIRIGRDHWSTLAALASRGLPVPQTVAGADPEVLSETAISVLGLPVVVKQRRSRMGVGVIRCTTRDHLDAVLDSLWRLGDEVIVQRWLPEGVNTVRVLVIGGVVAATAKFRAAAGEWRSNAARRGSAEPHQPTGQESRIAVAAADALGLGQCGVDLTSGTGGPVILEVNPTPGFLRLEETTGIDVAREIVIGAVSSARP
jgi:RimK family alpha-L-glutamate ligase